jgi:hypothetical protein
MRNQHEAPPAQQCVNEGVALLQKMGRHGCFFIASAYCAFTRNCTVYAAAMRWKKNKILPQETGQAGRRMWKIRGKRAEMGS